MCLHLKYEAATYFEGVVLGLISRARRPGAAFDAKEHALAQAKPAAV